MYPAKFDYHRAGSVSEALDLLEQNEDAKVLAGGHSLLPMMKMRLAQPATLVDIGRIDGLTGISVSDNGSVLIGALTRHADIADSDVLAASCPVLAEAAEQIGDPQVRNRGTIGGNIAHADPGSDLPAVIRALGGSVKSVSKTGEKSTAAADFFVDLLTTSLGEDEILTAVEVPALGAGTGSAYRKFEHPASGYAVVGAAAVVTIGNDGNCESASLCFNGVTATPLSADGVGAALVGGSLDDAAIDAAVEENVSADDPMGDVFASGEYRVHLAKVFGKRALKALVRAQEFVGGAQSIGELELLVQDREALFALERNTPASRELATEDDRRHDQQREKRQEPAVAGVIDPEEPREAPGNGERERADPGPTRARRVPRHAKYDAGDAARATRSRVRQRDRDPSGSRCSSLVTFCPLGHELECLKNLVRSLVSDDRDERELPWVDRRAKRAGQPESGLGARFEPGRRSPESRRVCCK